MKTAHGCARRWQYSDQKLLELLKKLPDTYVDTQWETYEVFHQTKRGDSHIHVGSVHAPDPQMALQLAKDQFARRLKCASLWVVRTKDVTATDYQDEGFFAQSTDKSYRDPKAFESPEKAVDDEH